MNSIQQMSYSGWEGFNISRNIESVRELGESVKQVALPIIESLGNTAFNALRATFQIGAKVVAFAAVSVATAFSGIFLMGLTGAASFVIYKMVTDAPKEEIVIEKSSAEEVKADNSLVNKASSLDEIKPIAKEVIEVVVVEEKSPIIMEETEIDAESNYEKAEVAIDSGDIY